MLGLYTAEVSGLEACIVLLARPAGKLECLLGPTQASPFGRTGTTGWRVFNDHAVHTALGHRAVVIPDVHQAQFVDFIEVKSDPFQPHATPPPYEYAVLLVRELEKLGLVDSSWVQSFDWRILRQVQQICPEITTCYLTSLDPRYEIVGSSGNSPELAGFDLSHFGGNIPAAVRAAGGRIWGPSFRDLSSHRVEEARAEDIPIHCWTVNHSHQIRQLIEWRLAGVTTDYPESVVRMTQNI